MVGCCVVKGRLMFGTGEICTGKKSLPCGGLNEFQPSGTGEDEHAERRIVALKADKLPHKTACQARADNRAAQKPTLRRVQKTIDWVGFQKRSTRKWVIGLKAVSFPKLWILRIHRFESVVAYSRRKATISSALQGQI